jgi:hypothetical protein
VKVTRSPAVFGASVIFLIFTGVSERHPIVSTVQQVPVNTLLMCPPRVRVRGKVALPPNQ